MRGGTDPEYGDAHSDHIQPGLRALEGGGAVGAVVIGNGDPRIPQVGPQLFKLPHLAARGYRGMPLSSCLLSPKGVACWYSTFSRSLRSCFRVYLLIRTSVMENQA